MLSFSSDCINIAEFSRIQASVCIEDSQQEAFKLRDDCEAWSKDNCEGHPLDFIDDNGVAGFLDYSLLSMPPDSPLWLSHPLPPLSVLDDSFNTAFAIVNTDRSRPSEGQVDCTGAHQRLAQPATSPPMQSMTHMVGTK